MKVSPITESGAATVANPDAGRSAGAERLARAKAIANGTVGVTPVEQPNVDTQVEKVQNSIKRIKMKTQVSTNRHDTSPTEVTEQAPEAVVADPVDTLAPTEQTTAVSEDTKPLSPQFAALVKQKRALQLEKEQLAKERLDLDASKTNDLSGYISKADLKANPLKTLLSEGVTYDQLTESILNDSGNDDIQALREEIKALKEGMDKTLSERDAASDQQVLREIRRSVDQLVATGDEFEMVRESGYAPKVVDLIHRYLKTNGVLMDESEAATLIENELLEESLKFARLKKVQGRLTPTQEQQQQVVQQDNPNRKIMRTLTNRDGVSSTTMSKRERAIAVMEGRLKP